MKTNYNIIGDIHGRTSWKELVTDSGINIFVGDYFDPYERIPHQQLMQNFADIIDFKKQHPETILLYGNHDLHYLIKQERASRYSILHARQYRKAFEDSSDLFYGVAHAIKDTILVSHAGVTKEWYEKEFGNYDEEAVSEVESLINDLWKHNKIEFTFDANALWGFDVSGSSHRPAPLSLSRQCFNKTNSHPEIYLFKSRAKRSDLLSEAKYLQDLSASYNMQVYLLEKKEDVYWRWLFFVEK